MRKLWNSGVNLFSMLTAPSSRAPSNPPTGNGHDFEFTGIDGAPLKLSAWRGRPLLIVNTASLCGFTKQYGDLQELWRRYESAGLIVIAVPSNDFGEQEPDADGEIRAFCQGVFGVTFPIASKQPVIGPDAHPFYKWAADAVGPGGAPTWNFHKYLVGRDGQLLRSFSTRLSPTSTEIISWIEKAIEQPTPAAA
ncbi:glutathione peroxidase [Hyphomicrobium sp.]|uniref:glutathione peroxidase n=1 Tax=Hyphomicrobium sp. TaxID=82 RepID=UPI000F9C6AD6|nr:glutathione peroxidase [Hyphomicrobium sp.]RUO97733.1 MAG: glutathione peroxidase [Hyphomicrobium sp.]